MRLPHLGLTVLLSLTTACGPFFKKSPETLGDPAGAQGYGYSPIDPLPVALPTDSFSRQFPLLAALPDETMRLAIGEVTSSGNVTFGPGKAGLKGHSYVVVLDYIKFQTQPIEAQVVPRPGHTDSIVTEFRPAGVKVIQTRPVTDTIIGRVALLPVYIGVGLRLTANVTVQEGSIDLGNLLALGAAAQTKRAVGTLVVQTLGVSGPSVSSLIPMPSDINSSTIQNALVAIGAIKAKLYDSGTLITPRIVGVYNTIGGGQATMTTLVSHLLQNRPSLQTANAKP